MAVKTVFTSSEKSEVNRVLECFYNSRNEIYLEIYDSDNPEDISCHQFIALDKETAIKLAKELRKQISFIESEEDHV